MPFSAQLWPLGSGHKDGRNRTWNPLQSPAHPPTNGALGSSIANALVEGASSTFSVAANQIHPSVILAITKASLQPIHGEGGVLAGPNDPADRQHRPTKPGPKVCGGNLNMPRGGEKEPRIGTDDLWPLAPSKGQSPGQPNSTPCPAWGRASFQTRRRTEPHATRLGPLDDMTDLGMQPLLSWTRPS